ncbi:MAG: hypothetical protein JW982_00100, partial [Spirochaetes bacterium]|nr:hypothetical protein [Spirochaetota bacterium]
MGILKILFYFILTIVIFNIVRVALIMKKAINGARKNYSKKRNDAAKENENRQGGKNSIIELGKDQYHV